MTCKFCGGECVKNGHQKNGKQRVKCKSCRRKQQEEYSYLAYGTGVNDYIISHIKSFVSIRDLAWLLEISTTTLMARILKISNNIVAPNIAADSVYEVDEIKTFVGRKRDHVWVAYALNRKDKSVASFSVGPRTNETLSRVLDKLKNAKRIYTDRLRQYKTLIHPASTKPRIAVLTISRGITLPFVPISND
jgi:transposase-like protein